MTKAGCVQLTEHGDSHREMHRSPGCSLPRHLDSALTREKYVLQSASDSVRQPSPGPTRLRTARPGYQLTGGR
jgi:hypothetical protein